MILLEKNRIKMHINEAGDPTCVFYKYYEGT